VNAADVICSHIQVSEIHSQVSVRMSSCSEHLVRQQLRTPKYIDTRPKMTCGQMIEIQRQHAASATYEQFLPATSCVSTLNGPSTRSASSRTIAKGHRVQDASAFIGYTSANATATVWNPRNAKPITNGVSQIQAVCYGPTLITSLNGVMPNTRVNQIRELQDTIVLSTLLATTDPNYRKEDIIYKARQTINNCCTACGKVNFASTCTGCRGVNPGDTNADGTLKWKSAYIHRSTVS
jgi:hypothetical protein